MGGVRILSLCIESNQPVRGPSLFARRGFRRHVRPRQPAPIVPLFNTQEYIRRLRVQADASSNLNQGGSEGGEQEQQSIGSVRQVVVNPVPIQPNQGQAQNLNSQEVVNRPPLAPGGRARSNSAATVHSFGSNNLRLVPNHQQMEQFRPQIGQSNTTMLSGGRGNILDLDALNRQVAQQEAIVEQEVESELAAFEEQQQLQLQQQQ